MLLIHLNLCCLIGLVFIVNLIKESSGSLTCRDTNNQPVDWFILYKLPKDSDSKEASIKEGKGYFYMDANSPRWTFGSSSIGDTKQSVAYTLQQIYDNSKEILYGMYNDETPYGKKSSARGHTKGVLASDKIQGYWMVHSVPKFPHPSVYSYPSTGTEYGQTFLCITLSYDQIDVVGDILRFTYPLMYNHSLPTSYQDDNPNLKGVMEKSMHVSDYPWNKTHILTTAGGQKFEAFSKASKYDAEMYAAWIAPYYQSDLCVESWQNGRGKLFSNCSGPNKVYNNQEIEISGSGISVGIKETKDHSKWAITVDRPNNNIVCIGGVNREKKQMTRGGGTVCMNIPDVYSAFMASLKQRENCNSWRNYLIEIDHL